MGNGWLDCVCQKCGKKFASFTLFGEDYCSECKEEKEEEEVEE